MMAPIGTNDVIEVQSVLILDHLCNTLVRYWIVISRFAVSCLWFVCNRTNVGCLWRA